LKLYKYPKNVFLEIWFGVLSLKQTKNGISKPFSKVPEKQSIERPKQPAVTCFYWMKRDLS